jgi:hypothetical protein
MDNLITLLTYFLMLSVAAERAVEISKNIILKKYNTPPVIYQILAGTIGGIMSFFSPPPTDIVNLGPWVTGIATGLAVSGGSSFLNTLLDGATAVSRNLKNVSLATPAK